MSAALFSWRTVGASGDGGVPIENREMLKNGNFGRT
jgi:hypothetical protein